MNQKNFNDQIFNQITAAAKIIRAGGVVAFPTETVYGLGADAFNPNAVEKIFELKQRPSFDPLIVHICSTTQLNLVCEETDERLFLLAEKFWPGPLTIVVNKNKNVPDIVTSGLKTVGIRYPSHPIAAELIKQANTPIAAPSANKFGRVSPTSADHVRKYFPKLDYIIDGGKSSVGIESTIIKLNPEGFEILRHGIVTREEIEKIIPYSAEAKVNLNIAAPGMMKSHYSPAKQFYILSDKILKKINLKESGLISFTGLYDSDFKRVVKLTENKNLRKAAVNLFSAIHTLEESDVNIIVAEPVPEEGIGIAIMDRLRKATYNSMRNLEP